MYLNKLPASTPFQLAQCSSGDAAAPCRFADPTEVYYQTIQIRSSENGGFTFADGVPVSTLQLADLCNHYPGDLIEDGKVNCSNSDDY